MTKLIRFEATQIEEINTSRPHYKVHLITQIFRRPATTSASAGLIPNEIRVTVHVPITVGTDLTIIKQAAVEQTLSDIKILTQIEGDPINTTKKHCI